MEQRLRLFVIAKIQVVGISSEMKYSKCYNENCRI